MEVRNRQWPPNIEQIAKVFPLEEFNPVFTYGSILYNPTGKPISKDLMAHEEVHEKQQRKMGVENWWKLYLENSQFRLEQEAEAYQAQARFGEENYNRRGRKILEKEIIRNLSSRLYNNLITKEQAREIIYGN